MLLFTSLSISLFPQKTVFSLPCTRCRNVQLLSYFLDLPQNFHLITWFFFSCSFSSAYYLPWFSYLFLQIINFLKRITLNKQKHIWLQSLVSPKLVSMHASLPVPFQTPSHLLCVMDPKGTICGVATVLQGLSCLTWCGSPHFGL